MHGKEDVGRNQLVLGRLMITAMLLNVKKLQEQIAIKSAIIVL